MDFIADNYIWFVVGGIVILMAVIGYFADKTDFGRRELRKKVEKEPSGTKEVKEETVVEKTKKDKKKEKPEKNKKKSKETNSTEELVENEEKNDNIVNIDEMFNDPIIATNNNEKTLEDANIDEALFAPLTDTLPPLEQTEVSESFVSEDVTVEPTVEQDFTEVTVDPLLDNVDNFEPVADEEDIWKF